MASTGGEGMEHVSQAALERLNFGAADEMEAASVQAHLGACESCYLRWIAMTPQAKALGQEPNLLRASAELLLEHVEVLRRERLDDAGDCAFWALVCAFKIPEESLPEGEVSNLRGRIWIEVTNLRRIAENFGGSLNALFEGRSSLDRGTRNPLLEARWLDVAGSLFRDLRLFPAALNSLNLAYCTYLQEGETHLAGRSLVKKSSVLNYSGDASGALSSLVEALSLIDVNRDASLLFSATHNVLIALADGEQYEDAARSLWRFRPLYRRFGSSSDQVRLKWLEAKVAFGLGQPRRAERLFRQSIFGFRSVGLEYEVAIVALELAAILLRQERPIEVLALLSDEVTTFVERHVYREAFVALSLLRDAVEQGRATERQIRVFAKLLDTSRTTLPRF